MLAGDERAAVLRGRIVTRTVTLGPDDRQFRLAARRVVRRGHREVVVAVESLDPVSRSVRRALALLLLACPVALVATAAGGWWLARRSLRPIERMTTTAEAIGAQRLDERLAVPSTSDEVAHLARTLNTMLARIERGMNEQQRLVAEQRRFVADASHELRTPLAVMRAELDVSLRADELPEPARELLESAREEVHGMSRTVHDLLTLATADEGRLALAAEPVDLQASAGRVLEQVRALARRREVALELSDGSAIALADAERLDHAVRNLVENAIEFSPRGGRVELTAVATGGKATLTVADHGAGIAAEHRERIFDRFYRVDPSRRRSTGGSGLGLAIAREIVRAHGGEVRVEPRDPGTAFVIEIPAAFNVLTDPPSYGAVHT
jgi:heavy metal sensor kinase